MNLYGMKNINFEQIIFFLNPNFSYKPSKDFIGEKVNIKMFLRIIGIRS